jgi:hypothetical protein
MEGNPEYKAQQERVLKEKISYLKKKIAGGESVPIAGRPNRQRRAKAPRRRPELQGRSHTCHLPGCLPTKRTT